MPSCAVVEMVSDILYVLPAVFRHSLPRTVLRTSITALNEAGTTRRTDGEEVAQVGGVAVVAGGGE